jgi:IS30 family transposase
LPVLKKVSRKTAKYITRATIKKLGENGLPVLTITYDNGMEFSDHASISNALNVDCYFAKPYHSWERGLNEHTNGLVRQYLPKKTDFTQISDRKVQAIAKKLNNRPRKILGYKTPLEVLMMHQGKMASAQFVCDG